MAQVTFSPKYQPIAKILAMDEKNLLGMKQIYVAGSVRSSKMLFLNVGDGSTQQTLQLVFTSKQQRSTILDKYKTPQFYQSTTLKATVHAVLSKGKGQKYDFIVDDMEVIGSVREPDTFLPALPNPSVATWAPHCDIRAHAPIYRAIYNIRSKLSSYTHRFMSEKGVKHLDPNVITRADCEGAGEMFIVTTLGESGKLTDLPVRQKEDDTRASASSLQSAEIDWSEDFFNNEAPARLTVSSQLGLEMLVPGMACPVWTPNPSFRAEKSKTTRHVASFTHVEAEFPWIEFSDLMDYEEEYVRGGCIEIRTKCKEEVKFLAETGVAPGLGKKLDSFVSKPFIRLSYLEALQLLEANQAQVMKDIPEITKIPKFGEDLGGHCENWLAKFHCKHPVFVYNMPTVLKSFYMRQNVDEEKGKETVQGVDLLIPGLGELIGGSMREHRYDKLVSVMIQRGMFTIGDGAPPAPPATTETKSDKKESQQTQKQQLTIDQVKKLFAESKEPIPDFIAKYRIDFGELTPYVNLRKNAAVMTGGFGLGFDRFVVVCTSSLEGGNIRNVIPFPVAFEELSF